MTEAQQQQQQNDNAKSSNDKINVTPTKSTNNSKPPPSPSPPSSPSPPLWQQQNQQNAMIDTFLRISLAGCGGALAGYSFHRQRIHSLTSTTATTSTTTKLLLSSPLMKNPTLNWALGCSTFTGIIELGRILSPTSKILEYCRGGGNGGGGGGDGTEDSHDDEKNIEVYYNNNEQKGAFEILSDNALSGALAGALFRGIALGGGDNNEYGNDNSDKTRATRNSKSNNEKVEIKNVDRINKDRKGNTKQQKAIGKGKVLQFYNSNSKKGMSNNNKQQRKKMRMDGELRVSSSKGEKVINATGNRFIRSLFSKGAVKGMVPGLVLGLMAGIAQVLLTKLNEKINEKEKEIAAIAVIASNNNLHEKDRNDPKSDDNDNDNDKKENEEENWETKLEKETKKMSTDEILKKIQELRGSNASDNGSTGKS